MPTENNHWFKEDLF